MTDASLVQGYLAHAVSDRGGVRSIRTAARGGRLHECYALLRSEEERDGRSQRGVKKVDTSGVFAMHR